MSVGIDVEVIAGSRAHTDGERGEGFWERFMECVDDDDDDTP